MDGSKTAAQTNEITNKNAVTFIVFSYSFSLSEMVFRYQSLRRVPLRSIPPNKSESSSWLKLTRSAWSSAIGQLNLPRSSRLALRQNGLFIVLCRLHVRPLSSGHLAVFDEPGAERTRLMGAVGILRRACGRSDISGPRSLEKFHSELREPIGHCSLLPP